MRWGLTCGWTSRRELKKGSKGGRPKWVVERRPVNRLRFSTFWKCRSQMYWMGVVAEQRRKVTARQSQPQLSPNGGPPTVPGQP